MIADASFAGSLAAVRVLGRAGIPVVVGGRGWLDAARWSRHTKKHCRLNTDRGSAVFLSDMKAIAAGPCRPVLLPTSDLTAWLYARHRDELSERFSVYVPSFPIIDTIVDKAKLWRVCQKVGIPTIESWFPQDSDDIASLKDQLRYPLVMKPRSHVHSAFYSKGVVVRNPEELAAQFEIFAEKASITFESSTCSMHSPPMLQAFVQEAVENVVSISGFLDRSGKHSVVRASRKVLQRSRPIGLGLAFESIGLDPALATAAIGLCRELGYFGIFEIEFIQRAGIWCLIDFNPRFYQEMALEIAAGAPLPLYAYLDACDDRPGLRATLAKRVDDADPHLRFTDTFSLLLRFLAKPAAERKALVWLWGKRGRLIDATFDAKDPVPGFANAFATVHHMLSKLAAMVAHPSLLIEARRTRIGSERGETA